MKRPRISFQRGEERIVSQRLASAHPEVDQPGAVVTICAAFDLHAAEPGTPYIGEKFVIFRGTERLDEMKSRAAALRCAIELAKERGGPASVELKVSAPFHCPLMRPARDGMERVLRGLKVGSFKFGVIANVTAEVNRDPARVVPLLLEQITAPVRWEESMTAMAKSGVTDAIEFGCGRVLMGLMRRIDRNVKVRPLEDTASLKTVRDALVAG